MATTFLKTVGNSDRGWIQRNSLFGFLRRKNGGRGHGDFKIEKVSVLFPVSGSSPCHIDSWDFGVLAALRSGGLEWEVLSIS